MQEKNIPTVNRETLREKQTSERIWVQPTGLRPSQGLKKDTDTLTGREEIERRESRHTGKKEEKLKS